MKKILLASYYYPPFPGVGAFRWAQLSKYLVKLGYEIHVITVDWQYTQPDTLIDHVMHQHIHIHRIPSGYPHNLSRKKFKNRILNGIRNKMFIHCIDRFLYKQDEAQRWENTFIPYALELIKKENIKIFIATGSPFSTNYLAAKVKSKNEDIKLIQDFRDPWVSNPYAHYKTNLALYEEAIAQEAFSIQQSDAVVCVTKGVENHFSSNYANANYKMIRNGYDHESIFCKKQNTKNKIKIMIHIGNIWSGREECCALYMKSIQNMPPTAIKTVFIGSVPKQIQQNFSDCFASGKAVVMGTLSHKAAMDALQNADAALQFNARLSQDAASTKIYEYAAACKPIFSINFGGEAEQLIKNYHWGYSINPDNTDIGDALNNFIHCLDTFSFNHIEIEQFSYENIAHQYAELIEGLINHTVAS